MKKLYRVSRLTYPVSHRGFTLVELIVVITIIGILAGLGFTNYATSQARARDGKRKVDLEQVRSALEMYRTDSGSYPGGTLVSGNDIAYGGTTYLTIPNDPKPGRRYVYSGSANSYTLCAALETETGNPSGCGGSCGSVACNYKVTNP